MIPYNPTPENIKITPVQESLMYRARRHIEDAKNTKEYEDRWSFWFRAIYDAGLADGAQLLESVKGVV